ncbi:MAG: D-cysteine desulfhydrase family protein [Chloroflexota bacterium]|nr:D-cysteine desulfhydrase family protein [Chloroflexota bacterium]
MLTEKLARVAIGHLPTPLEPLPRLTAQLDGPELWIKRDDQTGLATGGNKTRKLEFLVADAQTMGADTLITGGAAQSNHARQTAAAAAKFGLACRLVLRGAEPSQVRGNLLLDRLLGAEVVWAGEHPAAEVMEQVAKELRSAGRRPYVIPYGGSNPVGASGYVAALEELLAQCTERDLHFDHIALPSSSGGTQAGLMVGVRALGFEGRVLGISIDLAAGKLQQLLADLATETAERLGMGFAFTPEDFAVNDDYLGGGYGVVSDLEREAIRVMARAEGVLLDPVYTGRAFGGLLDLIRRGTFDAGERVLFWHTGGTTGLFGCECELI